MFVKIIEPTFIKGKPVKAGEFAEVEDTCAMHLLGTERAEKITEAEFRAGPPKAKSDK